MFYTAADHYWIVAGDQTRLWSSAAAAYVGPSNPAYVAWLAAGGLPTPIATEAELADVLLAQFPAGLAAPLPIPRHGVMTYTIVRRLEAAELAGPALAVLDAAPVARIKFQTTQWVWSDDPEALAMLAAVGANPATVMAIDPYWPSV